MLPASVLASPAHMSPEFQALRQPEEQPRTSNSCTRCQPPSQNRSPMRDTHPEYHTTFVPPTNGPLHLRGNSRSQGFESMRTEERQDSDNRSQTSELGMESLKANPHWHPSRDPTFIPFVPPAEIVFVSKEPIREEAADTRPKCLAKRSTSNGVVGGTNPVTGADFVLKQAQDHYTFGKKAEEDQSSFNTSETEDMMSDGYGSTETMLQGKSRKGLLRRDIGHKLLNKVNVFKRKGSPIRGVFRVQSRSGCMA